MKTKSLIILLTIAAILTFGFTRINHQNSESQVSQPTNTSLIFGYIDPFVNILYLEKGSLKIIDDKIFIDSLSNPEYGASRASGLLPLIGIARPKVHLIFTSMETKVIHEIKVKGYRDKMQYFSVSLPRGKWILSVTSPTIKGLLREIIPNQSINTPEDLESYRKLEIRTPNIIESLGDGNAIYVGDIYVWLLNDNINQWLTFDCRQSDSSINELKTNYPQFKNNIIKENPVAPRLTLPGILQFVPPDIFRKI